MVATQTLGHASVRAAVLAVIGLFAASPLYGDTCPPPFVGQIATLGFLEAKLDDKVIGLANAELADVPSQACLKTVYGTQDCVQIVDCKTNLPIAGFCP